MKGYLGRPDATREAIRDGWYVTGDIARFDEDGFITITDRLARFSKIGGEMVPHQKIEDELQLLLGSNERMFTVTALPDERKGERLVVLHTKLSSGWSVESLWKQLNGRGLPSLWVPSQRDFFEIAEMPVLGTGKIDLKRVKELAVRCAHWGLVASAAVMSEPWGGGGGVFPPSAPTLLFVLCCGDCLVGFVGITKHVFGQKFDSISVRRGPGADPFCGEPG